MLMLKFGNCSGSRRIPGTGRLTPAEEREQTDLLQRYQLSALRRAQAFAVLAQRGHCLPTDDEMKAELYDRHSPF
jgi:hypothetical protein